MTLGNTFPVIHPAPKPLPEAHLRAELTRLHTKLTAHRDIMPHWSSITARQKWAMDKDEIQSDIDHVQGQLRDLGVR